VESNKLEIKEGQFWLVERGKIARVVTRNADDSMWLVDRLSDRGSFCRGVGVADRNFEEKITPNVAKEKAQKILEKHVKRFFNF
jgi:hypothetical protein